MLRRYRRHAKLSQAGLAERVGGLTARSISRYERGESWPDDGTLRRLMIACSLDPEELFAPSGRRGAA